MDMNDLVFVAAAALGVNPVTAVAVAGLVVAGANLTGRLIPDDKPGFLGVVRKVAKVIGLYTPNKITSGVSVNDAARAVIEEQTRVGDLLDQAIESAQNQPIPPFPGLPPRGHDGKFVRKD